MLLVNAGLCDLFRPLLFDAENRNDDAGARRVFANWLLASAALGAAAIGAVHWFGAVLAGLLLAPEYRAGAAEIMLWVSFGYAASGLTQVVENRLLSLGHSARLLLPMICGAAANVACSVVLIGRNGIDGAAQATCASSVLQGLATVCFLLHALRRRRAAQMREQMRESTIEPA
jgi:O-antigen/teichoic acid export membrane protein